MRLLGGSVAVSPKEDLKSFVMRLSALDDSCNLIIIIAIYKVNLRWPYILMFLLSVSLTCFSPVPFTLTQGSLTLKHSCF